MTSYNLVIFHQTRWQHVSDFLTIRNMMAGLAPDIAVHVISEGSAVPADFWARAAKLPTLIFSPLPVNIDAAVRGTRIISAQVTKLEEAKLFADAGFPTPRTTGIVPETRLNEGQWGPFVVVKPNRGGQGRGIRLMRTRDVRWVDPSSWPKDDPRHGKNLLAQQYVDTGPYTRSYRVFTVLGHAVYSRSSTATRAVPIPDPAGREPVDLDITSNGVERTVELANDREIISLAESIHRKFPLIPTMGLDIIRHHATGQLFVLELNSSGFTWHLSSDYGLAYQRKFALDYYGQFDALRVIARAFIDTTRRMAV